MNSYIYYMHYPVTAQIIQNPGKPKPDNREFSVRNYEYQLVFLTCFSPMSAAVRSLHFCRGGYKQAGMSDKVLPEPVEPVFQGFFTEILDSCEE